MDLGELALLGAAAAIAVVSLIAVLRAQRGQNNDNADIMAETAAKLVAAQSELAGRLKQMAEGQAVAQKHMADRLQEQERTVGALLDKRLTEVAQRVAENLEKTSAKSTETMGQLQERLAVIDAAQKNMADMSAEVVSLQNILSNKQARGAIGQTQMEDLVRNMLPPSAYEFQVGLSNGKRADCVIRLPNPPGMIAVDSKYPHEAFMMLVNAPDERARTLAEAAFRSDVLKHIRDIADKYIIPGETADSAIMFVPAESVFAELHDRFPAVVEEGFRRRVYIVSPTTLMATLNTVRAVLKDARMREQAHIIQGEIGKMMEDVKRLDKRVEALSTHFGQTQKDVNEILTSTGKIIRRGQDIENIQLEAPVVESPAPTPALPPDEKQPPRLI